MCGRSDKVTHKIRGFQTENNRVKAAAVFVDVPRGSCGRIGVAN